MFALVSPLVSRFPSPEGSLAELSRIGSPLTGELLANRPVPPFCFTYIPCGANGSSALFESA
jgi:hypothetical protein